MLSPREPEERRRGIIFDLDGVLTDTAELHYKAWRKLAWEQFGYDFTRGQNESFKGVERLACMRMLAALMQKDMDEEQIARFADIKNGYYVQMIDDMTYRDLRPGVRRILTKFREQGYLLAVASASKNTRNILHKTGIEDFFEAVIDGCAISKPKPDPECFLQAAKALGAEPRDCIVFEDSQTAIESAGKAGFICVGVGNRNLRGTVFNVERFDDKGVGKLSALIQ